MFSDWVLGGVVVSILDSKIRDQRLKSLPGQKFCLLCAPSQPSYDGTRLTLWEGDTVRGQTANRRLIARPLYYFNLLIRGPYAIRLLNVAWAVYGPPGICK